MIRGVVNVRHEAALSLRVRGATGGEQTVDAIIDTGFTSTLTLPSATISALGLIRQSSSQAMLADGSLRTFDIYVAELEWDGVWRPVLVSEVGDEILVGMRLLVGHELRIAVVAGGAVEIAPLP